MKTKFNIPKTFFGFLTASVFFWLLINLSKEYNTTLVYSVEYVKLPQQKTLIETPINQLSLKLKSSGYNLLVASITHKPIKLDLTKVSKKTRTNYYFLSKDLTSEVQKQLKSSIELTKIVEDTIPLKIGTLSSKKIPLKPNLNITFQLGYDLSKPVTITPDSVLISGDETYVKETKFLTLENITLENLSKSTNISSPIIFPENTQLKSSHSTAEISIDVDKFTEGEIEVPVFVKNAPKGINVFPKKVKIIYKVGLQNFNEVTPDLFKVECDYLQSKNKEVNYLTPQIKDLPDMVTLVRIVPNKIDFLIYE
ncbi:hypothetical protein MK851_09195 [Tenacibaculum sp. 1B UA]|uniref:hypothetical protein n=1 Tax=unclassified Tenacibaculum TaxID=2635139 RepID=UPI0026E3F59E|nr:MULTISPECIES: hypothetical protein [unclassified Tenacibaculum]MDO6674553.1 hypothetical protein [Tenacibaculum sp. 1_MG-2023]MDX8553793.1 hypothetical protein [Tenacibaculum sp. 1B UA]